MPQPTIAAHKPYLVNVTAGKRYFWCSCGLSKRQPFCDGSHAGTGFSPMPWSADSDGERLFCACKRTGTAPLCDGAHNRLADTYAEAAPEDGAQAVPVDYVAAEGGARKAVLDEGCYVIRATEAVSRVADGLAPAAAVAPARSCWVCPSPQHS